MLFQLSNAYSQYSTYVVKQGWYNIWPFATYCGPEATFGKKFQFQNRKRAWKIIPMSTESMSR